METLPLFPCTNIAINYKLKYCPVKRGNSERRGKSEYGFGKMYSCHADIFLHCLIREAYKSKPVTGNFIQYNS